MSTNPLASEARAFVGPHRPDCAKDEEEKKKPAHNLAPRNGCADGATAIRIARRVAATSDFFLRNRPSGPVVRHAVLNIRIRLGSVANSSIGRRMGWIGPVSGFVNLRETEAEREQQVLFPHRPGARKAKPLAQPQHGLVWGV